MRCRYFDYCSALIVAALAAALGVDTVNAVEIEATTTNTMAPVVDTAKPAEGAKNVDTSRVTTADLS